MAEERKIIFMTEEPGPVMVKKFVTLKEGSDLYSIGINTFRGLVEDSGAGYRIGKKIIVNTQIMEEYLENFRM